MDSAWGDLAGTFVNAGFWDNKLMVKAEEGNSWIYKNKDHGMPTQLEILLFLTWSASMMSAMVSLGLSLLLDTDVSLSHVNNYTYSSKEHIKAGALFATGLLNMGV